MIYYTTYQHDNKTFCSYVDAKSNLDLEFKLKLRNLGEEVNGTSAKNKIQKPSVLYKKRRLLECIHTICFISMVRIKSELFESHCLDLVNDTGLIHDIIHELEFPEEFGFNKSLYGKLQTFDEYLEVFGF